MIGGGEMKKKAKNSSRVSNNQIWKEVERMADEQHEANGRQRDLIKELLLVKTRQEECPIWRGGRLNDPRVMLAVLGAMLALFELIHRL